MRRRRSPRPRARRRQGWRQERAACGHHGRVPERDQTRIGVFGGTFDPIHIGHLMAAVNVRHALALDVVLLVVANVPWQKLGVRELTSAEDRFAMVSAAVNGVVGLEASRLEMERGGSSYTAD